MNIVHEPKNGVLIPSRTMECWERSTLSSTCCPILKKNLQPFCESKQRRIQTHQVSDLVSLLAREIPHPMGNIQGRLSDRCWQDDGGFYWSYKILPWEICRVKYLSNFIIRILRTNKEPVLVSIKNYIYRRNEIEFHLSGPYLCHNLALPTLHKKAEQIFDNQPKQHQFMLGKHWRATNMDAHYQCSPETDHDFLRDSPLMEFQVEVFQASKWRGAKPVITAKNTTLARGIRQDSNLLPVEAC